ncbi:hypothetical protein [Variovorax sp. YR216]|uniref:hypothetical protein n=1 Tax=Variovorax sp. YR216 TaxID=1882828 RepID=UPI00089BBAA7|nr:hypothetical protein [Variovorax sp. YR216]SEA53771.1 hypothetical protein SAMN05444680_102815 [Variovorax sp. YR216]
MVHPTCAHAHLPNDPPARTDSPDESRHDPFELTMQALREIKSVRAAYHVVAGIHDIADAAEARELMRLTDEEFQRRVELAMAALKSMRAPSRPGAPGHTP